MSNRSISLAHSDLLHWFHGPQFLLDNSKNWSLKDVTLPFGEINLEKRSINIVVAAVSSVEQEALVKVIDCCRYGSLNKLLRVTGYVLRFKTNILPKLRNKLKNLTKERQQPPVVTLHQATFHNIFILYLWLKIKRRSDQGI